MKNLITTFIFFIPIISFSQHRLGVYFGIAADGYGYTQSSATTAFSDQLSFGIMLQNRSPQNLIFQINAGTQRAIYTDELYYLEGWWLRGDLTVGASLFEDVVSVRGGVLFGEYIPEVKIGTEKPDLVSPIIAVGYYPLKNLGLEISGFFLSHEKVGDKRKAGFQVALLGYINR